MEGKPLGLPGRGGWGKVPCVLLPFSSLCVCSEPLRDEGYWGTGSCSKISGNPARVEMVKGKETQGWELPLALIVLKQGCGSVVVASLAFQRAGPIAGRYQRLVSLHQHNKREDLVTDKHRPAPRCSAPSQRQWSCSSSAPAHPHLPEQPGLSSLFLVVLFVLSLAWKSKAWANE